MAVAQLLENASFGPLPIVPPNVTTRLRLAARTSRAQHCSEDAQFVTTPFKRGDNCEVLPRLRPCHLRPLLEFPQKEQFHALVVLKGMQGEI
jgi:hypothetical protein